MLISSKIMSDYSKIIFNNYNLLLISDILYQFILLADKTVVLLIV
jgi:hypothetical protein